MLSTTAVPGNPALCVEPSHANSVLSGGPGVVVVGCVSCCDATMLTSLPKMWSRSFGALATSCA
eukprot:7727087-Heterocapsa_arctica.AAC.1